MKENHKSFNCKIKIHGGAKNSLLLTVTAQILTDLNNFVLFEAEQYLRLS